MKKIVSMMLVSLAALAARADVSTESMYLYWNAESKTIGGFAYVQLKYALTSEGMGWDDANLQNNYYAATGYDGSTVKAGTSTLADWSELLSGTDWADYSFIVDAYDYNGNFVGSSDILAYGDIAESLYEDMGVGAGALAASTFFLNIPGPIPEPTSGLLLLFGIAGLALKRKRI